MKSFETLKLYNDFFLNSWNWLPYNNLILLGSLVILCGIFGIVFNEKNFLITMLCIELTYLGSSFIFAINGVYFFEPTGQLYSLILIITAAAEAAVGLGLLIVVYRYEKRIDFPGFIYLVG